MDSLCIFNLKCRFDSPRGHHLFFLEIVFLLLLLFVVVFGYVARRLNTPYPIILVIAGLLLSFVPGIPRVSLNPDIVFFVVFPPLLFSAAWLTSWREFRYNLVSILFLAFGLVLFTVFGVAAFWRWLPGFDWRSAFLLGAIVAPTDTIAANAIAKQMGLPKRVVDILEGESLVNDASGLLAVTFGISMVVEGKTPTVFHGILQLTYLIVVGIALGLIVGFIVDRIERHIDDAPIETILSILTPYVAYLAATSLNASGVLAVLACGFYLSRRSSQFFSANVRLRVSAFWEALTYTLNGLVFVLVGLQLPHVLAGIPGIPWRTLVFYGLLFSFFLILLRLIWMWPGAMVSYFIRRNFLHQNERYPQWRGIFVAGWTGMRGVISLAAAIALPQTLATAQSHRLSHFQRHPGHSRLAGAHVTPTHSRSRPGRHSANRFRGERRSPHHFACRSGPSPVRAKARQRRIRRCL
jgi:Na+/H+ antiporter